MRKKTKTNKKRVVNMQIDKGITIIDINDPICQ